MYWVIEYETILLGLGPIRAAHPCGSKRAAEALSMRLRCAGGCGHVVYDYDAPRGEGDFSERCLILYVYGVVLPLSTRTHIILYELLYVTILYYIRSGKIC